MKEVTVKRGDTWNQPVELYSDTKFSTPFNATSYTGKCYIKEELDENAPAILTLDVTWSDAANGLGDITMSHTDSISLRVFDYIFEVKIYTAANAIRKTVQQGILKIVEVLEKD